MKSYIGRRIFHPLVYAPNDHNGWDWAKPRPGARSFTWVSHMDAGVQGLGSSSTAGPGKLLGSSTENGETGAQTGIPWDASTADNSLTYYTTVQAFFVFFVNYFIIMKQFTYLIFPGICPGIYLSFYLMLFFFHPERLFLSFLNRSTDNKLLKLAFIRKSLYLYF